MIDKFAVDDMKNVMSRSEHVLNTEKQILVLSMSLQVAARHRKRSMEDEDDTLSSKYPSLRTAAADHA